MITISCITLLLSLTAITPSELETAGNLVEAGIAWESENSSAGQARILCRLLEEALYAGHGSRAMILMNALEKHYSDQDLIDFWYARVAWISGLESMAIEQLLLFSGEDWLSYRAKGMAHIMRRHPEEAIDYLEKSFALATTTRRRFYSALDLCWANIAVGNALEAQEIAVFMTDSFPEEGLPQILLAICYQQSDHYAGAMTLLQRTALNTNYGTGPRSMARDLLEDFE